MLGRRQGWFMFLGRRALEHFQVVLLHRKLGLSKHVGVGLFLMALGSPRLIIQSHWRRSLLSGPRDFLLDLSLIRDRLGGTRSGLFPRFIPNKPAILHHLDLFPLQIQSLLLLLFVIHFLKKVNLIFDQFLLCHVAVEIVDLLFEHLV